LFCYLNEENIMIVPERTSLPFVICFVTVGSIILIIYLLLQTIVNFVIGGIAAVFMRFTFTR